MNPSVTIKPQECLADVNAEICVDGLQSDQNITVQVSLKIDGEIFESFAHYSANRDGTVDLAYQASTGGSYYGIEAMGLFRSMKPSPANKRMKQRLTVKDVENPTEVSIQIFDSHLSHEDLFNGNRPAMARSVAKRWYKSPGVRRIPVRWKRVRGTLFVPEGPSPFSCLIDLFGASGGLVEYRASLLASRGYMTLALAYFDYDDLPKSPAEIDLEYFEEAKDFLQSRSDSDRNNIGVIGNSYGGLLALTCATYISGFACAISINGHVLACRLPFRYKGRMWEGIYGNPTLFYRDSGAVAEKYIFDDEYTVMPDKSLIEFAECNKPFLFLFGKDDNEVNTPKVASVIERLAKYGNRNYKIVMYPGAGHWFEPPHFPHVSTSYVKFVDQQLSWGGEPKLHAKAQLLAWGEILEFLKNNLAKKVCKL